MFSVFFASDRSSSGKSMITAAFSNRMKELGYSIDVFKVGPDFIDPFVLSRAIKSEVKNIDPFLMPDRFLDFTVFKEHGDAAEGAASLANIMDLNEKRAFIVESAMGLYDGNSYAMARKFKFPVVLVMDCRRISATMASLVYGLKQYKKGINICGVILNNISSSRHYEIIAGEIKGNIKDIEVFGYVPNDGVVFKIKERHLGLVVPNPQNLGQNKVKYSQSEIKFDRIIGKIKDAVFQNIDSELMINTLERESEEFRGLFLRYVNKIKKRQLSDGPHKSFRICNESDDSSNSRSPLIIKKSRKCVKIAVAYDKAFFFYYNFNFEILKSFGADIVFFSPLADNALPKGVKAVYIGGGYPEIYTKKLSGNRPMLNEIYKFFENNGIIYAECGGLMYLCKSLTYKGVNLKLSGILPLDVTMDNTRLSLGYRNICLREISFLGDPGLKIRGHEFHYSRIITADNAHFDETRENSGDFKNIFECESLSSPGVLKKEGYGRLNAIGSYVHLSFFSNRLIAKNIVDKARKG